MKIFIKAALGILCFISIAHAQTTNKSLKKQLYQYGVIDGLLAGAFDGDLTIAKLQQHGNFGIGTFNRADGEMLVLDNHVYRVRYNGEIKQVNSADSTPFACVTNFVADTSFEINNSISYDSLQSFIKQHFNTNSNYAIKISGTFDSITARAVAPGVKPYPTLKKLVLSSQRLFNYSGVQATCIGFFSADYLARINVGGFHMHFLSDDQLKGGHVFAFKASKITVSVMELTSVYIESNTNESFMLLNQRKDRTEELKKIE